MIIIVIIGELLSYIILREMIELWDYWRERVRRTMGDFLFRIIYVLNYVKL